MTTPKVNRGGSVYSFFDGAMSAPLVLKGHIPTMNTQAEIISTIAAIDSVINEAQDTIMSMNNDKKQGGEGWYARQSEEEFQITMDLRRVVDDAQAKRAVYVAQLAAAQAADAQPMSLLARRLAGIK